MADVIEETTNVIVLSLVLLILGLLVFSGIELKKFFGNDGPLGKEGALFGKNGAFGSRDGVSFSENLKRWFHIYFGGDDDGIDPGSTTDEEAGQFLANYQMPTPDQVQQAVNTIPGEASAWLNKMRSNPANLPFF
jgi:hypothetical protein